MKSLSNKRILLGITGGIAAYKCAELARLFVKAGAEVSVVMTRAAQEFVTPLTLQALSGRRVYLDLLDAEAEGAMGHIELARWADLVLIAPATADFIAKLAHGQADDLLSTVVLACSAPIAVAPAMNQAMWADLGTQANLSLITERKISVFGPGIGDQACGDVGPGRMLEPEQLLHSCADLFETGSLAGLKIVINGGPTREAIDPVRFISNHSSGKMAYALSSLSSYRRAHLVSFSFSFSSTRLCVAPIQGIFKYIGGCSYSGSTQRFRIFFWDAQRFWSKYRDLSSNVLFTNISLGHFFL